MLADYITRFKADSTFDRMFFVCHTPHGALTPDPESKVSVWTGGQLAQMVVKAGLFSWVVARFA